MNDYNDMIAVANEWGLENDPERRWFLAGWSDFMSRFDAEGRSVGGSLDYPNRPPENAMAAMCAYNSGWCAARDHRP